MKIDHQRALRILEEEVELAQIDPVANGWVERVERLARLCPEGAPKTHIAMLATALLAKATDPRVDVLTLKVGADTPGSYSARALAKNVLAANAPRLEIDLGVTGREPLNNQPYFRATKIGGELRKVVRQDGRPAFDHVVKCLNVLSDLTAEEARLALRAFLQVQKREVIELELPLAERAIDQATLVSEISQLVSAKSEGGKRAQAVAAGLLDALYGEDRVRVERVNDPDRRFPGDVAVMSEGGSLERAYEVRDKPVTENDAYHFVEKVARLGGQRAAVVAAATRQRDLDMDEAQAYAAARDVMLSTYTGWDRLVADVLFLAPGSPLQVSSKVCERIMFRLEELEASLVSRVLWLAAVQRMQGREAQAEA